MFIAFSILIVSIASMPALAIADDGVLQQIIAVLGISCLTAAAIDARTADIEQTSNILRPVKVAMFFPAIWMALQAIPMPISALSHSIWASTSSALQENLSEHISIDPGRTIDALLHYISAIALIVATILVTRDRRRAEQTLLALSIITTLTTLELVVVEFGLLGANQGFTSEANETLAAISSLGFILDLSSAVRVIERYESRHNEFDSFFKGSGVNLVLCVAGAFGCALAFASVATVNLGIAAAFAGLAFALVQIIRRFNLSPWSIGALCAAIIGAAAIAEQSVSLVLQLSPKPSGEAVVTAQRMVEDANWLGSGAGTFAALLPIYQDAGVNILKSPTTATTLAIEWGRPAMLAAVALAIWLVIAMFRGALSRGRDSFFPAAAAACVIVLLGQAFCNTSLSQTAVALVGEAVIGLGLAQRIGSAGAG